MNKKYQLGVCLFDDPARMDSGWACVSGLDPFRINVHADLMRHRNTIFITNSGWNEFNATGLNSVSYLRRSNFFKTSLNELAAELDFSLRDSPRNEVVVALADILAVVSKYAQSILPDMEMNYSSMSDALYATLPTKSQYTPDSDVEELSKSAWQENSTIKSKWEVGMTTIALNQNRIHHAEMVLNSPTPCGHMSIKNVTGEHINIAEILQCEMPIAIMADIEWKNSSSAELCAIGTGGVSYVPGKMREWYLAPEVMMLEPYVRFNIHQIATWSGWQDPVIPNGLFGRDDLDKLSLGLGLIAESYLAAMSSKKYKPKVKYFHPIAACWLKSIDRALSFSAARIISESGIRVKGYSYGQVSCNIMKEEINQALNIAALCGFYSYCQFSKKDGE